MKIDNTLRIIDANLNRLREALRVCEEVTRFIIEDSSATLSFKNLRHDIFTSLAGSEKLQNHNLIVSRDAENDIGKESTPRELKRSGPVDILDANMQRAKESVRVLEEFLKTIDPGLAINFKKIRFKIYDLEKRLVEKVQASGNTR